MSERHGPDASGYPAEPDPVTGGRQLERCTSRVLDAPSAEALLDE